MSEAFVQVTRGAVVESRHAVSAAIVDTEGKLVVAAGSPERITYWRSAAKPVQAIPLVAAGGMERFGFTEAELAVMVASHSGEEVHLQAVQSILRRIGLGEDYLRCGPHLPLSPSAAEALVQAGDFPRAIHSNCSGNHAGMLALAVMNGWPAQNYIEPDHPVQRAILEVVEAITGVPAAVIPIAIDGCGVPTYALTLHAMAKAFARLARPASLPGPLADAGERITRAMRRYPHMVAGSGRFDTSLMAATGERIIAKGGAEGVVNIGLPELGLGMALKVEDGAARAVAPMAVEILCRLGVLSEEEAGSLADLHRPVLRNYSGRIVGAIEPVLSEPLAAALEQLRHAST